MKHNSPHHPVRPTWLALSNEDVFAPEQAILDAHHHLWDRPEGVYASTEWQEDLASGHDVRASIYVQCKTGYRSTDPIDLQPVAEVKTVLDWTQGHPNYPLGLIAAADLQLGGAVRPILEALAEVGRGKVCGIRNTTAYHPNPAVRSNPNPASAGLLSTPEFREGVQALRAYAWCLDVWAYHTQLDEVYKLARAVPGVKVVINHIGGPLGVGGYDRHDTELFRTWQQAVTRLSQLPNTHMKLGGFGLHAMGYAYAQSPTPPHSLQLAEDWRPYVLHCIEAFGCERSMFESNFPVDKGQFSYRAVWNAFKRIVADFRPVQRDELFWRSAVRCYGLNAAVFS